MLAFVVFMLGIATIIVVSVLFTLSIRERKSVQRIRRSQHLHEVIFTPSDSDEHGSAPLTRGAVFPLPKQ
jgi:hypothetical protein